MCGSLRSPGVLEHGKRLVAPRAVGLPAASRSLPERCGRAVALALLLLAPLARAQDAPARGADLEATLIDVAEKARERTVLVYGVIGMGSGAVIDARGRVVTNSHVVAGARYALCQWADGSRALCRQVGIDYVRDLALLEPVEPVLGKPCFPLAPGRPREGSWVVAIGFPGGLSTDPRPTTSVGRVLPAAAGAAPGGPALDYSSAVRHDAPIFSGNSGGPLVDVEGRLVGINGAVDLEAAVSLTIGIDVVLARVEAMERGEITLPGGLKLDRSSPWLQAFYRLLDPLARQLPQRIADASKALVDDEALVLPGEVRERAKGLLEQALPTSGDGLANTARKQPRQRLLDEAQRAHAGPRAAALVIRLKGGRLATRVGPDLAVAKATGLPSPALVEGGACEVLARSEPDDLVLLRLPAASREAGPGDAPDRPVGSLVHALGPDGIAASGMVSVPPRRASGALAASVAQGGVPPQLEQAIGAAKQLAERLRSAELKALIEQFERALEARKAFAAGTPPRGYAQVLAIDAPVAPSAMGAPVCDRHGQLIGVAVAVPHHGTTHVVPMARIRAVFGAAIPGPRVPERRGEARLY